MTSSVFRWIVVLSFHVELVGSIKCSWELPLAQLLDFQDAGDWASVDPITRLNSPVGVLGPGNTEGMTNRQTRGCVYLFSLILCSLMELFKCAHTHTDTFVLSLQRHLLQKYNAHLNGRLNIVFSPKTTETPFCSSKWELCPVKDST